jgi:hypothetical protein
MPKRFNPHRRTANQGIMFVQRTVDDMDCVWRPTPNDDVGIDGEIELGQLGAATGRLIKVQVKTGTSYIANPKGQRFDFLAKPDDLEYWKNANIPVILVVFDPEAEEGYWKPVQKYVAENPEVTAKPHRIVFSRIRDRFVTASFLQLAGLVFPDDEVQLTDFLKGRITEFLYSNLLPVIEYPSTLYRFQLSDARMSEIISEMEDLPQDSVALGNGYIGFRDPRSLGSPFAGAVMSTTVETENSNAYLRNPHTRNKIVGVWNVALARHLHHLGLQQRDKQRFYFPPGPKGTSQEIQWSAPHRMATRTVAYPYRGKASQQIVFWVHHSLRASFREVGSEWFLKLEPGYVFTRDGHTFIKSSDAGALSTSRMSQERNYQVINHLYFWVWFLQHGGTDIRIPCGSQHLVVGSNLAAGVADFGLATDRKTLTAILNSDYDVNWSDIEESATNAQSDFEEEE